MGGNEYSMEGRNLEYTCDLEDLALKSDRSFGFGRAGLGVVVSGV